MEKLTWDQICKQYDKEWVHLIDYDWTDGEPWPKGGVVHLHAKTRKDFDDLMMASDQISGARIFVGKIEGNEDLIMMGNFMRVTCV